MDNIFLCNMKYFLSAIFLSCQLWNIFMSFSKPLLSFFRTDFSYCCTIPVNFIIKGLIVHLYSN